MNISVRRRTWHAGSEARPKPRPVAADSGTQAPAFTHVVLTVEDGPTHLKLLARQLEHYLGCRVLQADGVEAAVRKLLGEQPHLIITDLMMPDLNGYDLIAVVRSQPHWRDIPIVIHSAVSDSTYVGAPNESGIRDYILKPFDPSVVVPRIKTILSGVRRVSPARPAAPPGGAERMPLLVATRRADLAELVAREAPAPYDVSVVDPGPGVLVAVLERQPFGVLIGPDAGAWDGATTIRALRALKTLGRFRIRALPATEREAIDVLRGEFTMLPFSVERGATTVKVVIDSSFTARCIGALTERVNAAVNGADVLFEIPEEPLDQRAMAAIHQLAGSLAPPA